MTLAQTALGTILADSQGRTLYALTKDTNGIPTCPAPAARLAAGNHHWRRLAGLGCQRPHHGGRRSGRRQDAQSWEVPLYRFAGDAAPGDINGQGSGGEFFVVGADGKLIKA